MKSIEYLSTKTFEKKILKCQTSKIERLLSQPGKMTPINSFFGLHNKQLKKNSNIQSLRLCKRNNNKEYIN